MGFPEPLGLWARAAQRYVGSVLVEQVDDAFRVVFREIDAVSPSSSA